MKPSELIDLAVLGILSEGPASAPTLPRLVKRLGAPAFVPTTDVIETRLGHLLADGAVNAAAGGVLELTARGRQRIPDLLRAAGPSPAEALGAACHRLRVCLLDLLPPANRDEVIEDMIACHRRELDCARNALERCPCRCRFVERCLAREVARWESELGWLESIAIEALPPDTGWRTRS